MIIKTQTPSLKTSLGTPTKLHCQFDIDHKSPKFSVEWHKRGERTTLFRHTSRTKQYEGDGVDKMGLANGDVSYNVPLTKIINEGTYVCSVSVLSLSASLDISLRIEGEEVMKLGSWLRGG